MKIKFNNDLDVNEYNRINFIENYNVYAIVCDKGKIKYFICDHSNAKYPFWYSDSICKITDSRISKYWKISSNIKNYNDEITILITYPDWADNPWHYNYIVDGNNEEELQHRQVFKMYKQLMDLEFPDPTVELRASSLDDGWAMCPICIDAWEPNSVEGMIICPKCKNVMHNPFYQPLEHFKFDEQKGI